MLASMDQMSAFDLAVVTVPIFSCALQIASEAQTLARGCLQTHTYDIEGEPACVSVLSQTHVDGFL